jgi:PhnB protein
MAQLYAYLIFNGDCKQAMEFYKDCLGGELTLLTVKGSPMAAQMPASTHNQIMHSRLVSEKITLLAADNLGADIFKAGSSIRLCLIGDSKEELSKLYSRLSRGGTATHPLKEEFFGTYGDLTDKFGINWMFQFGGNMM